MSKTELTLDLFKKGEELLKKSDMPSLMTDLAKEYFSSKQRIVGNIPAKSNCYRIIILKNKDKTKEHGSLAKTQALRQYEKDFAYQCTKYKNKNIDYEFEIEVDVYFQVRRSDLDNSLKCLLDCLQQVNAIKNDNLCMRIVANKYLDPANPRIEFTIKPFKQ